MMMFDATGLGLVGLIGLKPKQVEIISKILRAALNHEEKLPSM